MILIEILKLFENNLSSDEFFESMSWCGYHGETFLYKVVKIYPTVVFKEVWKIIRNKVDKNTQLTELLEAKNYNDKTVLDEILKLKNKIKINFHEKFFAQVNKASNKV